MIIWRGWGIIGFAFPALGAILAAAIGSGDPPPALLGAGVILGAVGAFVLGSRLNSTGVDAKLDEHLASRRAELHQLAQAGQFQMAPGVAQPRSYEEAQQQVEAVLEQERQQLRPGMRNRHTLFFIPVQWFAALVAVVALALVIMSMLSG